MLAVGALVIVAGGLRVGAGRKVGWHGEGRGVLCRGVGGVWREKSGRRKQKEGEVAVASSPSYKCGAGVTALAITPASF